MVFITKNGEDVIMDILNITDAKNLIGTNKVVFITGVTGQDGSHMVDYLLKTTDYLIFGGARRLSIKNHENIGHLENNPRFHLVNFDLSDAHSISKIVESLKPDYFINLAAQTFVGSSWDFPSQTWECNTTSVIHILEAIRQHKPSCRFYNAGSSEEYGDVAYIPQDENHPARPRSPYGASKSAARQLVKVYRESYRLYAIQGLLFNHEGTRRGEEFVTRKITKGVARIKKAIFEGKSFDPIELGNVKAKRDWSDAEDFVKGIWLMLNQEKCRVDMDSNMQIEEYVLSSNETHTIAEFVWYAFKAADIEGAWHGEAESAEFSISTKDAIRYEPVGSVLVKINPKFYRPAEVDLLLGDSTKARKELGWKPETSFEKLVDKMVKNDIKQIGL
jgi:GDPmannose 4,6-dehydratase